MNNQNKSSSKIKNKDSNSSNKKQISLTKMVKLSPTFYQDIIEAENSFYEDPSVDKIERLILLYKRGSEYYSSINEDIARSFSKEVQNLLIHPLSVSLFKSNSKNKNVNKNTSSFDKNSSFDSEIKGKRKNMVDLIMKMNRVDSLDYSSEVKKIISKSNKSIFNFRSILKKEFSKQERILIAKRRRKKLFSDTSNDNICLDIYGRKSSTGSIGENKYGEENKKRTISLKLNLEPLIDIDNDVGLFSTKGRESISFFKFNFQRNNLNCIENSSDPIIEDQNKNIVGEDNKNQKNFKDNSDQSFKKLNKTEEFVKFLKEYHKKLYFYYQENIGDSLRKLHKILNDTDRKKISRFIEFQDNLKSYLSMGDMLNELLPELEGDYYKDIESFEIQQEENINKLYDKLSKRKMKDYLTFDNLNTEALSAIIKLFK